MPKLMPDNTLQISHSLPPTPLLSVKTENCCVLIAGQKVAACRALVQFIQRCCKDTCPHLDDVRFHGLISICLQQQQAGRGRGWWDLLLIMCGMLKINKTQCCSDGNEADADVALQQRQQQRQKGQPDKDGHLSAGVGLALLLLLLLLLLA